MWRDRHQLESLVYTEKDVSGGTSMARSKPADPAHLEDLTARSKHICFLLHMQACTAIYISHMKVGNECSQWAV